MNRILFRLISIAAILSCITFPIIAGKGKPQSPNPAPEAWVVTLEEGFNISGSGVFNPIDSTSVWTSVTFTNNRQCSCAYTSFHLALDYDGSDLSPTVSFSDVWEEGGTSTDPEGPCNFPTLPLDGDFPSCLATFLTNDAVPTSVHRSVSFLIRIYTLDFESMEVGDIVSMDADAEYGEEPTAIVRFGVYPGSDCTAEPNYSGVASTWGSPRSGWVTISRVSEGTWEVSVDSVPFDLNEWGSEEVLVRKKTSCQGYTYSDGDAMTNPLSFRMTFERVAAE